MRKSIICCLLLTVSVVGAGPIVWDTSKEPCMLPQVCAVYWYSIKGKLPDNGPFNTDFMCSDNGQNIQRVEWRSKSVPEPTRVQLDAIKATAKTVFLNLVLEKEAEDRWNNDPDVRTQTELAGKDKDDFIALYKQNLLTEGISP